ncbi:MAG: hypothetical protein ACPIOQ_68210, partial [Promethearchaeia archaeon]
HQKDPMGPRVLILGLVLVSTGSAFRQVSRNSVLVRPARALATRQGMPVPRAAGHGCLLTLRASGTPSPPAGDAGVGGLSKAEQADLNLQLLEAGEFEDRPSLPAIERVCASAFMRTELSHSS